MLLQPLDDLGNPLVPGLEAGPVHDEAGRDVGDGFHLNEAVLAQGLAGGDQVDDPLGESHERSKLN